jgi:putative transposase
MSRKQSPPNDAQERNTEIALFRYGLISALLFDPLAAGQLEQALRAIAAKSYAIPYSNRTRVSVSSLRRYLQLYNQSGFEALRPGERSDKGVPRAFPAEVLEQAIALREEQPARTTSTLVDILKRDDRLKLERPLNPHTLTSQLRRRGKTRRLLSQSSRTYQRFEREHTNSLWQGDMMVGPWLPDPYAPGKKRRAYLFCYLDDHSRLIPYGEFFFDESLPRMERVLKVGILRRGVPEALYVDNGRVYASNQFGVACAALHIRRIHAAPYSPEGKGKQERFFETVRLQFMPEVEHSEVAILAELNESFCHCRIHSETGQTPLARYQAGLEQVRPADPEVLRKAFLWREFRQVRKNATLDLQGNTYQVDPSLSGRKLELRFDPFDLSHLELFLDGNSLGPASVLVQNKQRHIAVERLTTQPPPGAKPRSSLDYLGSEYEQQQRKAAGPLQFNLLPSEKDPSQEK